MSARSVATWILLLPLLCPASGAASREIDKANGEQLMRDFAAIWASRDLAAVDVLYADDAVYEDVPDGTAFHGREAIRKSYAEDLSWATDFRCEVVSVMVLGPRGTLEWVWSGTQTGDIPGLLPATGRAFSVRGASVFEFEGGRIKKQSNYFDAAGFLMQLGVELGLPVE
jgi:steroid delta-isomerase-like uncharacterized protein